VFTIFKKERDGFNWFFFRKKFLGVTCTDYPVKIKAEKSKFCTINMIGCD
jgi:hypothetical protein